MYIFHINQKLKAEFMELDTDGDGSISIDEMEALLTRMKVKLQLSGRDVQRMVKQFDRNGDGIVDMQEFHRMIGTGSKRTVIHKALIQRAGIRRSFKNYDTDGNGVITREEFTKLVEDKYEARFSTSDVDELLVKADKNGDGEIDYEEFAKEFTYMPVRK